MSQDYRPPQEGGLFAECFQAMFSQAPFAQAASAGLTSFEPLLKSMARCNLEMMGLASRRAQVWMGVPSRAAQCRGPEDVLKAQTEFWRTAFEDYAEATQRITAAIADSVPAFQAGASTGTAAPRRDYITFPETAAQDGGAADEARKAA